LLVSLVFLPSLYPYNLFHTLLACSAYYFALKMEAVHSSVTWYICARVHLVTFLLAVVLFIVTP
jgi:hypothetical protein